MRRTALAAPMARLVSWLVVFVAVLAALPAAADPRTERDARALQKKAIEEDNLNVNYAAAVKKLQTAVNRCGNDRCSAALKASLFRDLGAMQLLSGNVEGGRASFGQAIRIDPTLDLDPSYKNPMLDGVWNDVKSRAGGGAAPAAAGGGAPAAGGGGGAPAGGDFSHTPPSEALVRTPLAIYVEYNGGDQLARVIAKYKVGNTWKTLELKKVGDGYGAQIPCKDVTQGTVQYYIQGFDAQNQPAAMSGSRTAPFTVELKTELAGAEPSLPGRPPPAQCRDKSQEQQECPPDFPGCKANKKDIGDDCDKGAQCSSGACVAGKCAEAEKKGGGDSCEGDDECASGSCSEGKCSDKKGSGEFCENDNDCVSGSCEDSKCTTPKGESPMHRVWIGVGAQLDLFLNMPAATDACIVDPNSGKILTKYQCVDPSSGPHQNFNFPGSTANNAAIVKGERDGVGGGAAVGNLRVMASFDYALNKNMLIGLRAGYVLFTDPAVSTPGRAFAPFHAELRYTYLLGSSNPLTKGVASFMIFGAVGIGEFDAFVPVTVVSNVSSTVPLTCAGQSNFVGTSASTGMGACTENAWATAGPVFAAVGPGVRFRLGDRVAVPIGLKIEGAFGGSAGFLFGVAPEAYIQFGF